MAKNETGRTSTSRFNARVALLFIAAMAINACASGRGSLPEPDGGAGGGNDAGAPASLKIVPPDRGVYLGAYDWLEFGKTPGVAEFEKAVGKKAAIVRPLTLKDISGSDNPAVFFDVAGHEAAFQNGYATFYGIEYRIPSAKTSPQAIINGALDGEIRQIASDIKSWGRPLFFVYQREPLVQPASKGVEPGFDGGGYGKDGTLTFSEATAGGQNLAEARNQYGDPNKWDGPERYVDAARHIHDLVESVAPGRVTWVMGGMVFMDMKSHPEAGKIAAPTSYADFYPGDGYVDWHAFDIYPGDLNNPQALPVNQYVSMSSHVLWQEALQLGAKPIMILEFGVFKKDRNGVENQRVAWFRKFFDDARTNPAMKSLAAFIYWQAGGDAYDGSDTRIRAADPEAAAWADEMKAFPTFWYSDVRLMRD